MQMLYRIVIHADTLSHMAAEVPANFFTLSQSIVLAFEEEAVHADADKHCKQRLCDQNLYASFGRGPTSTSPAHLQMWLSRMFTQI